MIEIECDTENIIIILCFVIAFIAMYCLTCNKQDNVIPKKVEKFSNTNLFSCESTAVDLSCPPGKVLDAKSKIKYGRWDNNVCMHETVKADTPSKMKEYDLPKQCVGVQSCRLQEVNKMFGDDPYGGVYKEVEADGICVDGTPAPGIKPTLAAPAAPAAPEPAVTLAPTQKPASQLKCGSNKFCVGMHNNMPHCYGANNGCRWNSNDCKVDADCSKYNDSSPKYTDGKPCDAFKAGDWPFEACPVAKAPEATKSWDYKNNPNEPTKSWNDMKAVCAAKNMDICKMNEMCPGGKPVPELNNFGDNDNWFALSDQTNEWGTYAKNDRLCKNHTQVAGSVPAWGTNSDKSGWARAVKCCPPNAMKGRFIKLQQTNVGCLNLAQIAVYSEANNINIIKPNMKVTKSSVHGNDTFPGANFVNGKGDSFVHTSCKDAGWVMVDMGSSVPIHRIVVTNRGDCCKQRANGIVLTILDEANKELYKANPIVDRKGNKTFIEDSQSQTNPANFYTTFTYFPPKPEVNGA